MFKLEKLEYIIILIILITVNIGLLSTQHDRLFQDLRNMSITMNEKQTNETNAILRNMTTQIAIHSEQMSNNIERAEGIAARTHNEVQQLLERSNDETNQTSRIFDILPAFGH